MTGLDRPRGRKRKFDIGQVAPADVRVISKEERATAREAQQKALEVIERAQNRNNRDQFEVWLATCLAGRTDDAARARITAAYAEAFAAELERALTALRSDFPNDSGAPPTQD